MEELSLRWIQVTTTTALEAAATTALEAAAAALTWATSGRVRLSWRERGRMRGCQLSRLALSGAPAEGRIDRLWSGMDGPMLALSCCCWSLVWAWSLALPTVRLSDPFEP